jgi:hypothetical protein
VKRLPEEFDAANPDEAYLAALLRRVHPADPSAEQMQRVWTTLERSPSRRPRGRASGPVIAGLLLCGATVASATMPHVWKRLHRDSIEATPAEATVTTAGKAEHHRAPPVAPRPPALLSEPAADTTSPAEAPAPQVETTIQKSARAERGSEVHRSPSSKSRTTVAEVDSLASGALMVEAMRERRAGHIARARELASEYRTKHPAGALQEEALALSFETAAALGDDEATPLARLYLQRYPRGRFRAQAQRVVDNAR